MVNNFMRRSPLPSSSLDFSSELRVPVGETLSLDCRTEGKPRGGGDSGDHRKARVTHREDLEREAHVVLPGHAQDVGQVQHEVDDASAGRRQVGPGEERADEEALQDGHHGEHGQKDKHHAGVAVGQQVSQLERKETP